MRARRWADLMWCGGPQEQCYEPIWAYRKVGTKFSSALAVLSILLDFYASLGRRRSWSAAAITAATISDAARRSTSGDIGHCDKHRLVIVRSVSMVVSRSNSIIGVKSMLSVCASMEYAIMVK